MDDNINHEILPEFFIVSQFDDNWNPTCGECSPQEIACITWPGLKARRRFDVHAWG